MYIFSSYFPHVMLTCYNDDDIEFHLLSEGHQNHQGPKGVHPLGGGFCGRSSRRTRPYKTIQGRRAASGPVEIEQPSHVHGRSSSPTMCLDMMALADASALGGQPAVVAAPDDGWQLPDNEYVRRMNAWDSVWPTLGPISPTIKSKFNLDPYGEDVFRQKCNQGLETVYLGTPLKLLYEKSWQE
ncbi:unnamed protein product [Nesidiocoris tenuis]|uniref:Uncharacterized protein n=1 Tax=Nesidiocoris tenuis TaxID=355587 RepID=A0A6H5FZK6_9HEMI|nr:unnamed protein product [Nesidiocoris tenuis]